MRPDEFDAELSLLEEYGVTPITLGQLFDAREGHGALPPRAVVLTFDDGRQSLYDHALPLLRRHHLTGELFLVTDYLAEDEAHRRRIPEVSGTHPHLLFSEVEEMQRSGAFVVESHTLSHPNLETLSEAQQRHELADSRALLQKRFGARVDFVSYPYGGYTRATRDYAEEAGYRGALAVTKGWNTRYAIHRVSLWAGDLERVRRLLQDQFGDPIRAGPPSL